jgi:hypothetical protein
MNKAMGSFVLAALCLGACDIEHYDECSRDDEWQFEDDFETGHRAGSSSKAGTAPQDDDDGPGGVTGAGGTNRGGAAGAPETMLPPATPCQKERDCDAGFNCNYDALECEPSEVETCAEMESEEECAVRNDCIPVYGGVNCSCGADCECQGGEPGCICETFDYLVCQAVE